MLDKAGSGLVGVQDILRCIVGNPSPARMQAIQDAFWKLSGGVSSVSLDHIVGAGSVWAGIEM